MLNNIKQKNSKKMGMETVRWQLLTIAFLSIFMAVFCMTGNAAASTLNITSNNGRVVSNSNPPEPPDIDCPIVCSTTYNAGILVDLTVTPDAGYEFAPPWIGDTGFFSDINSPTPNFVMLPIDMFVTANFQKIAYNLTTTQVGNGTVTASTTYVYDDALAVVAAADAGWQFTGWTGAGAGNLDNAAAASTFITNPTYADTAVQANFAQITYNLTTTQVGNGTVTASTTYVYDDALAVVATADAGWQFTGWTGAGAGNLDNAAAASTFITNPTYADTAVQANFAQITYNLTTTQVGNGTVTASTTYVYDDALAVVATADAGWQFTGWTGAGAGNLDNAAAASTFITNPTYADTAVQANFAQITYNLTTTQVGNGTVTASTTYVYDDALAVVATADAGWQFTGWTGAGAGNLDNAAAASTFITNPTYADTAVQANFAQITYNLTTTQVGNGTVTASTTYVYDDALAVVATADAGWQFTGWTGAGAGNLDNAAAASTFITNPTYADTAVQANFAQITYNLTTTQVGNGTVTASTTYVYDDALAVVATADAGWQFTGWTGAGAGNLDNAAAASTFITNPTYADTAVQANFAQITYNLTTTQVGNGTVTASTTYVYDDALAVVATADAGWQFTGWTGAGAGNLDNAAAASTFITNPTYADTAVQANFAQITYNLTTTQVGNGTVTASTTYVYDDALAVVATADAGWQFTGWTGAGAGNLDNAAAASTFITNPTYADTAVQANFAQITYNLTTTQVGNGTVTASTTYVYDDALAVVATADAGWQFTGWTGAGAGNLDNAAAASTFITNPTYADTAVQANFAQITYNLTTTQIGNGTVTASTTYVYDDALAVVATADAGWQFTGWTGAGAGNLDNAAAASTFITNPTYADTAVQANFAQITYNLTTTQVGNGTVTASTTYVYDDALAVVATADAGWQFTGWTGAGAGNLDNAAAASTFITNPTYADTAVQANFAQITYNLTTTQVGNGTVTASTTYVYDDALAVVATADAGWQFTGWTGAGAGNLDNAAAASTFITNPTYADTAVQANFAQITYNLTTTQVGNGTVTASTTYVYDDALAVVATADAGWQFTGWTGAGAGNLDNAAAASTFITNPTYADTAVQANFAQITYNLTTTQVGNGTVTASTTYVYDDALAVVATADAGWQFTGWTGAGAGNLDNAAAASTFITNPTYADTAVQANFAQITYNLTTTQVGNGTVTASTTYVYDDALAVVATADAGWQFTGWTGAGAGNLDNAAAASTFITNPTYADTAVQANFAQITYNLTTTQVGNGTVTASTTYVYDDALAVVATADAGWQFTGWTGAGAGNLDNAAAASTFITNPTYADTAVQANFAQITYNLTTTQVGNGTVTASTTYVYDDALAVAATPDAGWEFVSWTGDTANLFDPLAASTTIIDPTYSDTTVTANFQKITYTLTISVGAGSGSVAPATGTTYVYDEGLAIIATPAAGRFFINWAGDIANLDDASLESTNLVNPLTADTTIQANFDYLDYLLTVNTTGNGSVTKAPDQATYHYGDIVTLTATPDDEGWVFKEWIGDVAEPLLQNTTVMIDSDKTVTAVFEEQTYTLHLAVSGGGSVTPSAGIHDYIEGQVVNLNAVPLSADWVFDHWSGDVADPSNSSTTVSMDVEQTVTAFFITSLDPNVDHDGDGYSPNDGDCNDSDADVYPGAPEICGDGIDQDCNGLDTSCDVDNDGDGYWANDVTSPDYDCNDNDGSVHPGAQEICEDNIDQDCDGFDLSCDPDDTDGDGDGYTINMGDCNDGDAAIHPGATEIPGNAVDEDCYDGARPLGSEALCVDLSDTPLDTQVASAPANIMLLLDDSGSMDWEFTTNQSDGLFSGYYFVFDNAGDNAYSNNHVLIPDYRRRLESQSSGYNKMYYDPASTYTPWPSHTGAGSLPDADPNNPRSNPDNATPTFNLDGVYMTLSDNTGPHVTVTRENSGTSTCADAVAFRRISDNSTFIIDNSQSGFETEGNWVKSSGQPGYDFAIPGAHWATGYSIYSSTNGDTATWKTSLPGTGNYEVYAWWTTAGTRPTDAPYEIFNGTTSTGVVDVNQQQNAGQWNSLGIFNFNQITPNTRNIIRAHYYKWHDADGDTNVDDGETYLIELNGAINYYRFNDNNGNGKLDYGELTNVTGSQPSEIIPKNSDGTNRTYAQERQNFANWYSFYRKRELTAKAAVAKVIDEMSGVQIGILTIHNRIQQSVLPVKVGQGGTLLDDSDTLLGLLYGLDSSGGTPLRRGLENIGRYFDADDGQTGGLGNSPYVAGASGACQQAFTIVMTDGYYNGGDPVGTIGNADGDNSTTFDGVPFGDTASNTLADIAMHYYERDLSVSLANQVPLGGSDTARHQHMVTYTVSFGVFGSIDPANYLNCPNSCPTPWPGTGNNQGKIDDMYHAAVNGRGEYLSAENPQTLVDALNALKTSIEKRIGSGASVAINSQQLSSGSVLFQGIYDTNAWAGDIQAYHLDPHTGAVPPNYTWSAHEQLELMDWDSGREIITFDGTDGVEFRHNGTNPIPAGQLALIDANSVKAAAIVDFLRGDDTNEQGQAGTYSFRSRTSKLGDIVHSSPLLAGDVLYVGSNNGMLHAFDIPTGNEIFAYVPRLVFESLYKLTVENPNYAHTYFIDQPPYLAKVGTDDLLVGTLGKGGKGVYCLNVTNITNAETNASDIVEWEYPDSTDPDNSPDLDLGYGFSRAFIVDSKAGPVVIFSNGYESANDSAVLYVLDPADGSIRTKIDTGVGDAANCNGLSTPVLIDIDLDKKVDFAYAGDLLGNMWKFDLRDSDPLNWTSAYMDGVTPKPLFQAKNAQGDRQPITMKPDVMRHCAYGRDGYMVLFGTGRYLGNADFTDVSVQTLYGIWDWQDAWENEVPPISGTDKYLGSFTASRTLSNLDGNGSLPANAQDATLLEQTQIYFGTSGGEPYRVLSDNVPKWYSVADDAGSAGSHVGWYFNLPATNEKAFKDVMIFGGVDIAISSLPSDSACASGGDSILHAIDACTGARLQKPYYDINGDGSIDSGDLINIGSLEKPIWVAPTGWLKSGMYYPPAILGLDKELARSYYSTSDGTVQTTLNRNQTTGLADWREIE